MSNCAVEHVRRVRSVVLDRAGAGHPATGSRITRSWIRCLNEYQLDPGACVEPQVVAPVELRERQERLAEVQEVAKVEMANLYQQLAGSGYAIMLTDREGVLLNYFGDPAFTHAASRSGLMQGAIWSERVQGTNGMGTCLVERRPISVHQDEHFLSRNIGLSCAAAPIFDHEGELVGVLDASGESRLAQQHTLALVSMSVQMIENRVFLHRFRHDFILRFHNRPEFVGTLNEGAIALTAAGTVLAATRGALLQLGYTTPAEIVGRDISQLFNITFPGLVDSTVRRAYHPVPIFEVRSSARFFAVVFQPVAAAAPRRPVRCAESVLPDAPDALAALHFGDPAMAANVTTARRVMERNVSFVLLGETGTGKEMFARAVHAGGSRAARPFVAINCASIPETLIESELFGYRSGAFTGASKDGQRGKLLQANGGTLFLDEIGDMPVSLQARLLRVLEEREVVPLGGETPVRLDIRLISATHCDLLQKIEAGQFREDLYYRLQGVTLTMPPLRERADRRALIRHLAAQESDEGAPVVLDEPLLAALEHQRWPGNVRELRHLLRTMVALREADRLTLRDLPPQYRAGRTVTGPLTDAAEGPGTPLNPLESAERDALLRELQRLQWNMSGVARQLNISRNTLYRKLQRLNIDHPDKSTVH
ncbi:sigma-54-dependent Fis family transcriptional regulator [Pseudoduganella plicata]|uniref:Sigma-54-dependent Fis family transcriptional regulator n=1 Tax=Pseudoduganella plicata TaxID=321984 RepID=A0A4P7BKK1_9BURK|nr:sigma-54-dependent Fis family transcriptional regulator [Pseudoduganella plicata]QBQ38863.1 sigma-54-dependent Fis family transcriptional regulator [Pseudoduganella plicata]GGZ09649.1 sigma-54-dependent Fis family transcriptional regulator [Pseudoduganella plicata]